MSEFYESGTHRFSAEVSAAGFGSRLTLDGVEVPNCRAFKVEASVDGASLEVEIMPGKANSVEGFVNTVIFLGSAFVACAGDGAPVAVFADVASAGLYLQERGIANGGVIGVPFRVQR